MAAWFYAKLNSITSPNAGVISGELLKRCRNARERRYHCLSV